MKKFKFEEYSSESYLLQSPRASAHVGCRQMNGWEVVWVNREPFIEPNERRIHGEKFTLVDSSVIWVETPSGRKVKVRLDENQVFYL